MQPRPSPCPVPTAPCLVLLALLALGAPSPVLAQKTKAQNATLAVTMTFVPQGATCSIGLRQEAIDLQLAVPADGSFSYNKIYTVLMECDKAKVKAIVTASAGQNYRSGDTYRRARKVANGQSSYVTYRIRNMNVGIAGAEPEWGDKGYENSLKNEDPVTFTSGADGKSNLGFRFQASKSLGAPTGTALYGTYTDSVVFTIHY